MKPYQLAIISWLLRQGLGTQRGGDIFAALLYLINGTPPAPSIPGLK